MHVCQAKVEFEGRFQIATFTSNLLQLHGTCSDPLQPQFGELGLLDSGNTVSHCPP
jgi:hypothetical protein